MEIALLEKIATLSPAGFLALACWALWKMLGQKEALLAQKDATIAQLQELRVEDGRQNTTAMLALADKHEKTSDQIREDIRKLTEDR